MLAIAIYVLFVSVIFGPFISFPGVLRIVPRILGGDFITDYYCKHKTAGYDEVSALRRQWLSGRPSSAGSAARFAGCWSPTPVFINGPFATGVFENSSLGLFVSFRWSMAAYRLTPDDKTGTELNGTDGCNITDTTAPVVVIGAAFGDVMLEVNAPPRSGMISAPCRSAADRRLRL